MLGGMLFWIAWWDFSTMWLGGQDFENRREWWYFFVGEHLCLPCLVLPCPCCLRECECSRFANARWSAGTLIRCCLHPSGAGLFILICTRTLFWNAGIVTPLALARREVESEDVTGKRRCVRP